MPKIYILVIHGPMGANAPPSPGALDNRYFAKSFPIIHLYKFYYFIAVVGANAMVDVRGKKIRGRQYPWGVIEVENPAHCDFVKLRTMLITHMQDLQEVTGDLHYENYRSQRLAKSNGGGATGAPAVLKRPPPIGKPNYHFKISPLDGTWL